MVRQIPRDMRGIRPGRSIRPGRRPARIAATVSTNACAGLQLQWAPGGHVIGRRTDCPAPCRRDVVQQPVLPVGRASTRPADSPQSTRWVGGVETHPPQRRQPISPKIGADRATVRGQLGAQPAQHGGLEVDDVRLIDLVHRRARTATTADTAGCPDPTPRITTWRMPARPASARNSSRNRVCAHSMVMSPVIIGLSPPSSAYRWSSTIWVKYCTPAARTNCSANGSLISPLLVATRPGDRAECRGHSDAGGRVPRVVVCPRHRCVRRRSGAAGSARRPLANRATTPR